MSWFPFCVLFGSLIHLSISDTPANCTYDDISGEWYFKEGPKQFTRTLQCLNQTNFLYKTRINLLFPNLAIDEQGHQGHWTLIYNQGFEVIINYRKYFAFSFYKTAKNVVKSYCDRTFTSWSHDILGNNWACFTAEKLKPLPSKTFINTVKSPSKNYYRHDYQFIKTINENQKSWVATHYKHLESKTLHELFLMAGGTKSKIFNSPAPIPVSEKVKKLVTLLPSSFDWRNVSGVNYVTPVRNQGSCGSCFAFASSGMLESRLRVYTNNKINVVLSPQDVLSCSQYSQGCDGGFPYLVAGKYGQDFGFIPEDCMPYKGIVTECFKSNCTRIYVAHYNYVGGYYGGCNEELMKIALIKNGPLSVAFEVYDDFFNYRYGIYHHTGLKSKYNPFMLTNHGVLLVGYGVQNGEKYWIIKNSWGTEWGEEGYFRIRRGVNECAIESIAVEAFPIP